jgi:hypothetical protein
MAFIGVYLQLPVCVAGLLLFPGYAWAGQPPEILGVYREGERLVYDVSWLGIKAGQATLEALGMVELNGQTAYHLVTTATSTPWISKFYRVDDRSESYLAQDSPRALRFEKHLREGRYRHSSRTDFDHAKGMAKFRYLDFGPVPREISRLEEAERFSKYVEQEFPLTPGALDELSVLYYVRTQTLAPGNTLHARVFASRKNWDLEVKVLRRETLETALGRRETVVVEPLLTFEGIFQRKGRVIVWLTDDAERIPVQMQSQIIIGSFFATLVRREVGSGLAHLGASGEVTR